MNAVDFIRMSLQMSEGWIMGLVADIKESPLTMPTPQGGNHALWCMGHLAFAEANLVQVLAKGGTNPLANWGAMFDQGTQPSNDASAYPSIDEVIATWQEVRAATMAYLDTLSDADLDKPSHTEGEMAEWFGTIGKCLAAVPIHFAFHGGQIADARRAAGRGPLMG